MNVAQSQSDWFVTDRPSPVVDGMSSFTFLSKGDGGVPSIQLGSVCLLLQGENHAPNVESYSSSSTVCIWWNESGFFGFESDEIYRNGSCGPDGNKVTSSFAGAVDGRDRDLRRGRFEGPDTPIQGIVGDAEGMPFCVEDGADELRSIGMSE